MSAPTRGSADHAHTFHIPVMGTGYTIDSPVKVARYGISSAISLVDDLLIEKVARYHAKKNAIPLQDVDPDDEDARSLRITRYLNLLDEITDRDLEKLRGAPFEHGSEITRYHELLPDGPRRTKYLEMLEEQDESRKNILQSELRQAVVKGGIDANIMTKIDRFTYRNGEKRSGEFSDALTALKGFADSRVRGSMIFSAGMNPRLYGYIARFKDFFPDERGEFSKKIVLKVSDFRSAMVQAKFLARSGLWVSEFRIESSLNCGGHAFATEGMLLGPILEEFRQKKGAILEAVTPLFKKGLKSKGYPVPEPLPPQLITVQGGIGTAEENSFLMDYYHLDGTGWATPFLLVPEVSNVDSVHLEKLSHAGESDVHLSDSSPLLTPFWMLSNSHSEQARLKRISDGRPGSSCRKGFLHTNSEFTDRPICIGSREYQKKKLTDMDCNENGESTAASRALCERVTAKACICHDLSGGVTKNYSIDDTVTSTVCCGPNIVNFDRVSSLKEMVDHIYGRAVLMSRNERPHMFSREIGLYRDALEKEIEDYNLCISKRKLPYFERFKENISAGIDYYFALIEKLPKETRESFERDLHKEKKAFLNLLETSLPR